MGELRFGRVPPPSFQMLLDVAAGAAGTSWWLSTATSRESGDKLSNIHSVLKPWMGAVHSLTRTLPRVKTEMSLHVLAYSLKRMMKIIGPQGVKSGVVGGVTSF